MTPLAENLRALLLVQAVDSRLDRVRATLAAVDSGAATAAAYNTGKADFDRRRSEMVKAQADQRDSELRLQSIEEKTTQVNGQLYGGTIVAARELKNLQKELDMLARQKADSEEKVLATMEATAGATGSAQKLETELTQLADTYRGIRTAFKARNAGLAAELKVLETERAKAAKSVPASLLATYETIRLKRGGIGAAAVEFDDTCGACHIKLNTGLRDAVRDAHTPQLCEFCGRVLVPLKRAPE